MDEKGNCFIEEINQNELMSKKHKIVCRVLNYIKDLLVSIPSITGCVSISAFASLVSTPTGITSSAIGLNIWVTFVGIKRHKSIIKNKKKKHDKIQLLAKSKLNTLEVLISKALIDWNINHDEIFLILNVLK